MTDISRRACFMKFELPLLRPLPAEIFEIKFWMQGKVKRDYYVIFIVFIISTLNKK